MTRLKDLHYFWANIFNQFQRINQYSGNSKNNVGIPKACEIMNSASEVNLVKRVRDVIKWAHSMSGQADVCISNSYNEYITKMSNTTYDKSNNFGAGRAWMYQCCSYLGYFTTTNGGYDNSIWGSIIPLNFFVDQCIDVFSPQFNLDYTHKQVKRYRNMFEAAKHYKGSKCIFVNGNMDPWYSLGLLQREENPAKDVFAIIIDMGAHCSDMCPAQPHDSPTLKAARTIIASKLRSFIQSS